MEHLLYLTHRLPYPPNKGDKIRSWHFLKGLAEHYRIHLGTFIDDPEDHVHLPHVQALCASVYAPTLNPGFCRLKSLTGLLRGEALSLAYYRHRGLRTWVDAVVRTHDPRRALVFSSPMGQYLVPRHRAGRRLVADFVDVDSAKWLAYSETGARLPLRWVYRREAERLLQWETALARQSDAGVFVSAAEAELFNSLQKSPLSSVTHVDNGVDLAYFDPALVFPDPWPTVGPRLVFTGAMDYRANVDAVVWFCRDIWPAIRAALPTASFAIVGARPAPDVRALVQHSGVIVTGTVADVRPWLGHAAIMVAPLRIARGIQNKVLEGMAMNLPVVGTSAAFEGIVRRDNPALWVADDARAFSRGCVDALSVPATESRAQIRQDHDWSAQLERLRTLLEGAP